MSESTFTVPETIKEGDNRGRNNKWEGVTERERERLLEFVFNFYGVASLVSYKELYAAREGQDHIFSHEDDVSEHL